MVTLHTAGGTALKVEPIAMDAGLAVTPSTEGDRKWRKTKYRVTHVASGFAIGHFLSKAAAVKAMRTLVTLPIDWHADKDVIVNAENADRVRAAIGQV